MKEIGSGAYWDTRVVPGGTPGIVWAVRPLDPANRMLALLHLWFSGLICSSFCTRSDSLFGRHLTDVDRNTPFSPPKFGCDEALFAGEGNIFVPVGNDALKTVWERLQLFRVLEVVSQGRSFGVRVFLPKPVSGFGRPALTCSAFSDGAIGPELIPPLLQWQVMTSVLETRCRTG